MSVQPKQFPGGTVLVFPQREEAATAAAEQIADLIRSRSTTSAGSVLGLATGSTPIPIYQRLAELVRGGSLSFERVTTFNLDEYYPMSGFNPQSYRFFMNHHLFQHVGIAPNRAHLLDGTVPESAIDRHAREYDHWIEAAGGLDLQLLGLGRNGHIGFNEPSRLEVSAAITTPTRLINLHPTTREDATRDFGGLDHVPHQALTMGPGPILNARSIVILAFGSAKADAVARSLTGPMTAECPGSLLQHVADRVTWFLDAEAASLVC